MENKTSKKMPDLSGYTGTTAYHKLSFFSKLKFTDGMAYLLNQVGAYWLGDIVASVQHKAKVQENSGFLVWRIVVKDGKAVVDAHWDSEEDGSYSQDKLVYSQKINYTDFPDGTFEFYQQGDVVLLKGEH